GAVDVVGHEEDERLVDMAGSGMERAPVFGGLPLVVVGGDDLDTELRGTLFAPRLDVLSSMARDDDHLGDAEVLEQTDVPLEERQSQQLRKRLTGGDPAQPLPRAGTQYDRLQLPSLHARVN